jgi:hypothetical protein
MRYISYPHPSIEYSLKRQLPDNSKLTFYRCQQEQLILYRCPLLYHFTSSQSQTLVTSLQAIFPQVILSKGWLELPLNQQFLSMWLSKLPNLIDQFFLDNIPANSSAKFAFLLQYTHARYCALLRLAAKEKIKLIDSDTLNWHHPSEIALIMQILTVCDVWERPQLNSLTVNLCQAMLDFDRSCRILGESPQVQRSRLTLITVAQKLLNRLLSQKWQLLPMTEM